MAFALDLNRPAPAMRASHLTALRDVGLDDGAILDLVQIVGYFAFVNRLADALGVPLEGFHASGAADRPGGGAEDAGPRNPGVPRA